MVLLLQIYTMRLQIMIIASADSHQCLHCSSSRPDHIKNSIIYSQTLRLSNICTYEEDCGKHVRNMKSWFLERVSSKQMIDSLMEKVKFC